MLFDLFGVGLAAVKLPPVVVLVMVPKIKFAGCAVGVTQGVFATAVMDKLSKLSLGRDPVVPPVPL